MDPLSPLPSTDQSRVNELVDQLGQLRGQEAQRDEVIHQLTAERDSFKARAAQLQLALQVVALDLRRQAVNLDDLLR